MKAKRRKFTAAFKAKVAIESIKERETLPEIAKRFGIHPNLITRWKQEFISRSSEIFETKSPEEGIKIEQEKLYAKIGQLEMEKEWLKKKFGVL